MTPLTTLIFILSFFFSHAQLQYFEWSVVSPRCRSIDFWGTPWFPLDICSNSNSDDYQGSYSEKFVCDESINAVNRSFYWGYDCIGHPEFSATVIYGDGNVTAINCDQSLPLCNFANYSTFDPLPDEQSCSTDKSVTNWASDSHVIGQCECSLWPVFNDEWTEIIYNVTECIVTTCNETGIYGNYMWDVDPVQYALDPASICDVVLNDEEYNYNDTWLSITPYIEATCENKQQTEVYCQDSKVHNVDIIFVVYFVALVAFCWSI